MKEFWRRHRYLLSRAVSTQSFPDRWRWSPDGVWCFWMCERPSPGLGQPPDLTSKVSPRPAQVTSRPKPGSGWLGSCLPKSFSVFLTIFSHPCNVLAAVRPLFSSFNLPNALSHRGDQKLCGTSRNAKHLQWVTAAEVPARAAPGLEEWGGSIRAAAELVSKAGLRGKRSVSTGWYEERKQRGRGSCKGPLLRSFPTCLAWSCQRFSPHSLSPKHFHRKNNLLEYRGLQVGFWKLIPSSSLTNNHEGLKPLSFAIDRYFKMHFTIAVGVLSLMPTEGAFAGSVSLPESTPPF